MYVARLQQDVVLVDWWTTAGLHIIIIIIIIIIIHHHHQLNTLCSPKDINEKTEALQALYDTTTAIIIQGVYKFN